jgi:hypothetical protein
MCWHQCETLRKGENSENFEVHQVKKIDNKMYTWAHKKVVTNTVSAADLKRTVLSSGKFPASHYAILIALVVHDLLSGAKNLVQKME